MKRFIKEYILRAIRSKGYDIVARQKVPFSIFIRDRCDIAEVRHAGQVLKFLIGNPNDVIQSQLMEGSLYEIEELALIEKHYDPGTTFVDIGSNIGNHAIWAARCLEAPKVICFEPVLGQHTLLCANIAINGLNDVVTVHKIALSSASGTVRIAQSFMVTENSGAAQVSFTGLGEEVRASTGDLELSGVGPMFIKIDVEGHEMRVLQGLEQTIQRVRPKLFVEVDNANAALFENWIKRSGYHVLERFQRYQGNCNFLIAPVG